METLRIECVKVLCSTYMQLVYVYYSSSHFIFIDESPLFGGAREEGYSESVWLSLFSFDAQSRDQVLGEGLHQTRTTAPRDLCEGEGE